MKSLNYIGSKHTLLKTITEIININIGDTSGMSFMDLFAGTGVVGHNMLKQFKTCDSNDLEKYSYIINYALLKCNFSDKLNQMIEFCNKQGFEEEGLIYKNYSPNETCERMFFTNSNAKKGDAIRTYIEKKLNDNLINMDEYYFLIASLLVSIDKVANTSCVYGAYLKSYKTAALKDLLMVPIHTNEKINTNANNVYNLLAENFSKADSKYYDVIYLDPPYNQRQYGGNYSPLNFIADYNPSTVLTGKTGLIENYNKSCFCKKGEVHKTFCQLIGGLKCKYLIISYNNEGLLSIDEFREILIKKGAVKLYKIKYNKFKAQQSVDVKNTEEYLWFVDTTQKSDVIDEIAFDLIKYV